MKSSVISSASFAVGVVANMQKLQSAFRNAGIEVLYTTIESLTKDGRDRSLDYKITGFNVAKGSWDGKVIDAIAPGDDEIVFPKSSSSVFVSTHIDYVLRNLGNQTARDLRPGDGSMRGIRRARRLRSGISGNPRHRRLCHLQPATPRQFPG